MSSSRQTAAVGVVEHGNAAVLVTVAGDGRLLDRRRVDLTDPGLPSHPHHHEGSWAVGPYVDSPWARPITLGEAVALVERVRESAGRRAREHLDALAAAAQAIGWSVRWYDSDRVFRDAAAALGGKDVDAFLREMGRAAGPPWQAKHELAAAAALAVARSRPSCSG